MLEYQPRSLKIRPPTLPCKRRLLERIAESACSRQPVRAVPVRKPPRGTVLIREWQGVSHQVTVVDDAVVYREQRYGSLSEWRA
jgi:hypothetical protein